MGTAKTGAFSRNKGRREEQALVQYLAKLGYQAERILRQYQFAGQADVKATKDDKTLTFEMKSRRESFKSIYDLYYARRSPDGVYCYADKAAYKTVALTTHFPDLLKANWMVQYLEDQGLDKKQLKAAYKLTSMEKLKQSASFLVIKDNNKPRLFIRYWG